MSDNELIDSLGDPEKLEMLFRSNPQQFCAWLDEASSEYPESETLRVWNARVYFTTPLPESAANAKASLLFVIVLCLISGFLVKLPAFLPITEDWYYPRFVPLIVVGALIVYFMRTVDSNKLRSVVFSGMLLCAVVLLLLPYDTKADSIIMALIHAPLVLNTFLAIAFMSEEWRKPDARLRYIRYVGEMAIYVVIILLGGIVLTLLTLGLFNLIDASIEEWYIEYIVVIGVVASPIVATHLYDSVLARESKLATVISNVFSPLFLITVIAYLIALIYQGKSPYTDRNFLIVFNGLLMIVLAITVFSVSGMSRTKSSRKMDAINISLVSATLVINAIALSAIIFRLSEYGISPNRLAVTGANVLIFLHLILILKEYIKQFRGMSSSDRINKVVANYLPAYSAWSAFVMVMLPLIFWFE